MIAAGPAVAQRKRAAAVDWYDRAIVIDALGGLGDPYVGDDITRMSDRAWQETMATGVTMLRHTVFPVGNVPDPWGDYQKAIAETKSYFLANPDRLLMIRAAADILQAKREKKFGVLLGTQDTAMVGP